MKEPFTEKELSEWEEIRKKGKFSYAFEKAIVFLPLFFIGYLTVYYFLGEEKFGFQVVFYNLIKSFITGFSIFFVQMLSFEYNLKKSKLNSK